MQARNARRNSLDVVVAQVERIKLSQSADRFGDVMDAIATE